MAQEAARGKTSSPEAARWAQLNAEIVACTACPRLVAYRQEVARTKRRAFRDWDYWGLSVPGFGDPQASGQKGDQTQKGAGGKDKGGL